MARLHPKLDNTQKRRKKELTKCPISLRDAVTLCALQSDGYYYPQKSFFFLARASLPPDSTYVCITQPYSYLVKGHQLSQTACSVQPLTFFLFFGCKRWEVLFFFFFFWATFESKDARQTLSIKLNLPLPFFFFLVDLVSMRCSELY